MPAAGGTVTGVGKYRYIAALAEGGMADVFLAVTQSAGFEKLVVIKQLRESLAEDPSFIVMFMDEARLAARLNHPNVVQTLEVGAEPAPTIENPSAQRHFIAMEFLEGVPYARFTRLRERPAPPLAFHLRILVDVLRGLHYAHELRDFDGKPLNVVHRDVSPQNVMITWAGGVKVLDFGIAKAALAAEQRAEDLKGKIEYMAPEQARLDDVDRRADVFAVGVMLWEALTRRRLYTKGQDKLEVLLTGELPDVLTVRPDASKRLVAICRKAMARDRDARYPTADAMADDIEEWLGSTTQHVSARNVGAYVAEKFASTRKRVAEAIEAQLTLFREIESAPSTSPSQLLISRLPEGEASPELSDPPPPMPGWAASIPPGASADMKTSTPSVWTSEGAPMLAVPRPAPITKTAKPASAIAIAVLLAFAILAGGVAVIARAKSTEPAKVAATAASTEEIVEIDFTIKATPPSARIFIDGKPEATNPASGRRPRDATTHVVRIEAPGYETREEQITFERSLLVMFELHQARASDSSARPRFRGAPQPRRTPPKPGANLDTENPY